MNAIRKLLLPTLLGLCLGLTAIIWQLYQQNTSALAPTGANAINTPQASAPQAVFSYANAVNNAAPSVVNIYSTKVLPAQRHPLAKSPLFRRFFGLPNTPRKQRLQSSLGSGVIVDSKGLVLTNHHVIADADEILVALRDGRETQAQLIGSDPESDLALLKIPLENLDAIETRQSENLQIGDVVLAIGNPFNIGQTVTMGIISATGRNSLGLSDYEDYIQTDAAINQGNSGGALVDAQGFLIGINTATFSSSEGIGFAIPWSTANRVMHDLARYGKALRGWLGIEVIQTIANNSAPQLLITNVTTNSPAQNYGLRKGDIILAINNQNILGAKNAMQRIGRTRPGDIVKVQFVREGNKKTEVDIKMGIKPQE